MARGEASALPEQRWRKFARVQQSLERLTPGLK